MPFFLAEKRRNDLLKGNLQYDSILRFMIALASVVTQGIPVS